MATSLPVFVEKQFRLIADEIGAIGHSRAARLRPRKLSRKISGLDEAGREKLLEKLVSNHLGRTNSVHADDEVELTINDDPGVGPVLTRARPSRGLSREAQRMMAFSQSVPTLADQKKDGRRRITLTQAVSEDNLAVKSRRRSRAKTDTEIAWGRFPNIYLKGEDKIGHESGMEIRSITDGENQNKTQSSATGRWRKNSKLAKFTIPEEAESDAKYPTVTKESTANRKAPLISAKSTRAMDSVISLDDNWILRKENEERMKRMERTFAKLMIPIPEDDFPDILDKRFRELAEMTKPVIRPHSIFDQLDEETKERVLVSKGDHFEVPAVHYTI
jgi:hypothetical protein